MRAPEKMDPANAVSCFGNRNFPTHRPQLCIFFLSKRKPGKSFQNTSLGNHSLVLARDGKRTEGMQKSELRLKTKTPT